MRILYVYRNASFGYSIGRSFNPIEEAMKEHAMVDSIVLPGEGYSLSSLVKNCLAVRKKIHEYSYDIIHITGQEHYLIPFLPRKKVVTTVHDLGFTNHGRGVSGRLKWLLFVYTLRFSGRLTSISEKSRKEVIDKCHIPAGNVLVIPNCVNPSLKFRPKQLNAECPQILHIGLMPNKNLDNTILALKGMPCKLRIVGPQSDFIPYKEKLEEAGIDYCLASNLSDAEIEQEYDNCDIVNFPSFYEGFGLPIVEGQAVGRVVVTSNLSPMKEIAGDGAVLIDPYSVMSLKAGYSAAIRDYEAIVERGRLNVHSRFDVFLIAQQYYNVYIDLMSKNSEK